MTPIVYRQIDLVDRCFLIEAVWWVGLCRAPETAWTLGGKEWRFDEESNNDYEANPFDEMITNVECEFARLPPNPEYQALIEESDDYSGSLIFLEKFVNMVEGEAKKEIEDKLSVLWETSAALDGISHYMHICVDVKTLLDLFPIDEEERENVVSTDGTVKAAAGQLFWLSDGKTQKPSPIRSGRPPIVKWDEFLVEVTRRLQNDEIPDKQEAFVLDMRQWCWKKWGRAPARSTVIQKISPYHRMFIRNKKS